MNNPRDTQFANFAKKLFAEMVELHGYIDVSSFWNSSDDETVQAYTQIIAQRAYDFACHVVWQVGESNASAMDCGLRTPQKVVNEMDDMLVLPGESKE